MDKKDLRNYQKRVVKDIIKNKGIALFMDMGLGKTISVLTALEHLAFDSFEVDRVLLTSSKKVIEEVWMQEAKNWKHTKKLKFSLMVGTPKQRNLAFYAKADIYLISIDNIKWLFETHKNKFDVLIVDESSLLKNHNTNRFKTLRKQSFERVILLSGTPNPNSYLELWPQIYLIDKGKRLGKTVTEFRNKYFNSVFMGNFNKYEVKEPKEIQSRIKDIAVSMKSEDYLELKPVNYFYSDLKLTQELEDKYNRLVKDLLLEFSDKDIELTSALALTTKLLQFCNGFVYDEDKKPYFVHDLKIKECKRIVENSGNCLIAYYFQHDLTMLQEALKDYSPETIKQKGAVERWNKGKTKVLLIHPKSAGHGLNLQNGGQTLIWYSLLHSFELYRQTVKRLDRPGKKEVTRVFILNTAGTVEKEVIKTLEKKGQGVEELVKSLNKYKKIFEV